MTFCPNDFARNFFTRKLSSERCYSPKNIINVFETSGKSVFGQMASDKWRFRAYGFGQKFSGKKVSVEIIRAYGFGQMCFRAYGFGQTRPGKSFRVKKFRAKLFGQNSSRADGFGRIGGNVFFLRWRTLTVNSK